MGVCISSDNVAYWNRCIATRPNAEPCFSSTQDALCTDCIRRTTAHNLVTLSALTVDIDSDIRIVANGSLAPNWFTVLHATQDNDSAIGLRSITLFRLISLMEQVYASRQQMQTQTEVYLYCFYRIQHCAQIRGVGITQPATLCDRRKLAYLCAMLYSRSGAEYISNFRNIKDRFSFLYQYVEYDLSHRLEDEQDYETVLRLVSQQCVIVLIESLSDIHVPAMNSNVYEIVFALLALVSRIQPNHPYFTTYVKDSPVRKLVLSRALQMKQFNYCSRNTLC